MDRLKNRPADPDIPRCGHTEPSDQFAGFIRKNIAKKVGRYDNLKIFRVFYQAHCHGVYQQFLHFDTVSLVFGGDPQGGPAEQAVGQPQDVGFVDHCYLAFPGPFRQFEGVPDDSFATFFSDNPLGYGCIPVNFFLAAIEPLGILANHVKIEVVAVVGPFQTQGADRAQVGIEVEFFAERNHRAAVFRDVGRGRNRAKEGRIGLAGGVYSRLGNRVAHFLVTGVTGFGFLEMQVQVQIFQHHAGRRHHLRPNAITFDNK